MLDLVMHNVRIFLLINPPLSASERRSCYSGLSSWLQAGSIQCNTLPENGNGAATPQFNDMDLAMLSVDVLFHFTVPRYNTSRAAASHARSRPTHPRISPASVSAPSPVDRMLLPSPPPSSLWCRCRHLVRSHIGSFARMGFLSETNGNASEMKDCCS